MKKFYSKLFPNINVKTVDDYFNLDKKQRTKFGIYLKPYSLPSDLFNENVKGWKTFDKLIRKEFPIQGWIREWFFSYDNSVYSFFKRNLRKIRVFKYKVKFFIKPMVPRMRNAWKRHEYMDICDGIIKINFALIQDFWYEEVKQGYIDWGSSVIHEEFYIWLENAINYIEIERENLLKKLDEAEHNAFISKEKQYELRYGEVTEISKLIEEKDTKLLKEMIEKREMFWT